MARGDAAFRIVSGSLFGLTLFAGGWLAANMVNGFQEANKFAKAQKEAADASGGGSA